MMNSWYEFLKRLAGNEAVVKWHSGEWKQTEYDAS